MLPKNEARRGEADEAEVNVRKRKSVCDEKEKEGKKVEEEKILGNGVVEKCRDCFV